jgi:hypothetical protein
MAAHRREAVHGRDTNGLADRQTPNIFIVDKGRERDVTLRLRTKLWDFCAVSAVCLAASLWLVRAAWPWLDSM